MESMSVKQAGGRLRVKEVIRVPGRSQPARITGAVERAAL
jgi:hypothetical protein